MIESGRRGLRQLVRLAVRRPERAPRDLDEEVRFHIAERVAQLEALGWTPEAAHDEARRRFGPFDETMRGLHAAAQQREERLRMVDMVRDAWQDIRLGARVLRRYPSFSIGAVITLAVGIGAASAMFAVVRHSLIDPLPFAAQDRLVFMGEAYKDGSWMPVSYPNFADWRAEARSFDAVESFGYINGTPVLGADQPILARIQTVSRGLFEMLGVRPMFGRWIAADENRPGADATIVVSEDFWRDHLGAPADLSGVTLTVWGRPRHVVGVMPRSFQLLGAADIWFPLEIDPVRIRGAGNYMVVGRLRPGLSMDAAKTEMNALAARLKRTYGDESVSSAVVAESLRDQIIGTARRPLLVLLGAAIFVLLVTCANVAMMLMVRGAARLRETAVRIALGSGRWRLVRQAAAETSILVLVGSVGGLAIAWGGIVAIRRYAVDQLPRLNELTFDLGIAVFAVVLAATVAVLFSFIPAIAAKQLSRQALGSTGRASGSVRPWSVLVGVQVASTVMLMVGAALIVRTVTNILDVDVGYDPRDVTAAFIPLTSATFASDTIRAHAAREIERNVETALPGAVVGLASALPTDHGSGRGPLLLPPVVNPNSQKEWAAIASTRSVTTGYFKALHIRLMRGRWFNDGDRDGAADVALVNQSLATKLWPGQDPIGKRVRALVDRRGSLFTVVGVVAEARDWRFAPGTQLELYVPFAQRPSTYVDVVARSSTSPAVVTNVIGRAVHSIDRDTPVRFSTLSANLDESMADRRFIGGMLVAFAAVVLMLTIVGTFGAVSYAVAMRTREIGIRLAVGATPASIWLDVERRILVVVAAGMAVGVAAAWAATRALGGLLYGLSAHDATSFGIAPSLVCVAGLAAAAWPAFRASRTDPSTSLRAE